MGKFEKYLIAQGWSGRSLDFALGGLCVLGLAPFHIWPLALLGLGLFKLRLDFAFNTKRAFNIGLFFGFGFFLCGMYWIGSAFLARGTGYVFIMPPMIFGLALLLALFWGFGGRLYKFITEADTEREGLMTSAFILTRLSSIGSAFVFASVFTLIELSRGHVLTGLPWNLPGYIFPAGGAPSQSAAYISIYGLTALVFLLSALLANILCRILVITSERKTQTHSARQILLPFLIFSITLSGLWGFGAHRLSKASVEYVEGVKLRIVQVRFDQSDHFERGRSIGIVNQYIQTTAEPGLEDVTHVIWPEGAVSGLAIENESLMRAMSETLFDTDNTPPVWLLNSLRQEQRPLENGRVVSDYYNSSAAITFDRDGFPAVLAMNDKTKLVPFGEFVPFGKWVEQFGIQSLSTAMASISPAEVKRNAQFPGLPPVSPQICYEIIFPGMTPRKSDVSPEWILNQSNDAWYGNSIGPHQHFNQARYRAIEEGLPLIRAAANGLSGSIDAYGRTLKSVDAKNTIALDIGLPKGLQHVVDISRIILFLVLINIVILIGYSLRSAHRARTV